MVWLEDFLDFASDYPVGIDIGDPRGERLERHVAVQRGGYPRVPTVGDAPRDLAQSVLLEGRESAQQRFLSFALFPLGQLARQRLERIRGWRWRWRRFDERLEVLIARLECVDAVIERLGIRLRPRDRAGPRLGLVGVWPAAAAVPGDVRVERLPRETAVAALRALGR